jgi:ubiquinone/menaquinone biosynthesis C-methylase UbiE
MSGSGNKMSLDYTKLFQEIKRLSFPDGYWLCLPEDDSFYTINALVFLPYLGRGSFEILVDGRSIVHETIPMPEVFAHVAARLTMQDEPVALRFEVPERLRDKELVLQCRDALTQRMIGCAYRLPMQDYDFGADVLSSEMKRVIRTSNENYFKFTGYDDSRKLLNLFRTVVRREKLKILDWGVGAGRVARHLRRVDGVEIFGADIDPVNMETLHSGGWPKENFKLMAPGGDIPFDDGSFDACFGISVFTHLTEKLQFKYLREINRVLKPGGVGIFSVHGMLAFFSRINDGNLFTDWVASGIHVAGSNQDISEGFPEADEQSLYVDTLHMPSYVHEKWAEYFAEIRIVSGQNVYGHDLIMCIKAP